MPSSTLPVASRRQFLGKLVLTLPVVGNLPNLLAVDEPNKTAKINQQISTAQDLTPFIQAVRRTLASHVTDKPGAYRRWITQNEKKNRDLGVTVYGCADAAHILYTIGDMPGDCTTRSAWITQLQSFQDPDSGLFVSKDLHPLHTTAFCVGALELFEARPLRPLRGLDGYATREGLHELLDSLDWIEQPWKEAHRGAGIFGAMVLAGSAPDAWQDWYFEWMWENQDPATGLWRRDCIRNADGTLKGAPLFHHLASSFHYLFNHDYARRPLRYTEPLVDFCLELHRTNQLPPMARGLSWNEIDFLYTMRSLQKRTPYRTTETNKVIHEISEKLVVSILAIDPEKDEGMNDLHSLFAGLCSLAVAQEALPGLIRTPKPLRLVLERRPFL